jgi:AcrR family transcriptional regulator
MATTDTRTAILDAAERLFARDGFDGTSIREITREANVNVAAIHYHFGSKEAVLRGVTDRVVTPINERRIQLLTEVLDAGQQHPPIDVIIEAFIRPDIEALQALHRRGPTVAHFLGRLYLDQTPWIQQMAGDQFTPSARAFFPPIAAAVEHLEIDTLTTRMQRIGVVIAHTFASWPAAGMSDAVADRTLGELVLFCTGALTAAIADAKR